MLKNLNLDVTQQQTGALGDAIPVNSQPADYCDDNFCVRTDSDGNRTIEDNRGEDGESSQTKSWLTNILNNPQNSLDESKKIIKNNDVRCPEINPLASQLSGGNLQKFILGRSLANNPKVAIFSQPTWGVDIGAATAIRQKLLDLSQNGKAVILISQDLEEIFELSDKICVINEGVLSEIFDVREITAADVGLLMGGQNKTNQKMETY